MSKKTRWILTGVSGNAKGREFVVLSEEVHVGRTSENDIVLNEKGVSRHHALVGLQGNTLWVQDLSSKNGTFVNRKKISRVTLQKSDLLQLGECTFRVDNDQAHTQHTSGQSTNIQVLSIKNIEKKWSQFSTSPTGKLTVFAVCFCLPFVFFNFKKQLPSISEAPLAPQPIEDPEHITKTSSLHNPESALKLLSQAQQSLQMKDYLGAWKQTTEALMFDSKNPKILSIKNEAEKKLRKLINTYEDNALREFEKSDYEKAYAEWTKVSVLSKDFDPVIYDHTQKKLEDLKPKLLR